ncbi:ATP-dependent helicase HrpB [Zhihengliuella halotolerans]|uniref:ATP-dependent helicase HrpB n=1 Tax=Zhihengliuella halotolerans TaxID=370736 RepID=A0A4Q8AEL7_9MICC|nr:ATP-dependent helicase HrpB [Zhihengliuella halotolerans]RZU62261.1 ATP-dependent helicase HrpB [Zhihengliuella halotolerans]
MQGFDLQHIGRGLAFAQSLAELRSALAAPASRAVVQAPPGTGKTTLVPPLVAELAAGDGFTGRIVVTQPRRVAARAAARRLAQLTGTRVGDLAGYSVRGESRTGAATRIEFVTAGILLRRLLADPGLESVAAVVLDEVHERALETDLLLGVLADVHALRGGGDGDLRVVAMSATVDAPRFASLLGRYDDGGPAPVIDSPSVLHPLEVRWVPMPSAPAARSTRGGPSNSSHRLDERGVRREFLDHVAATAADAHAAALAADPGVDALVFVPGAREVSHVVAALARRAPRTEVLALHGQLPPGEQDRAVAGRVPGEKPRIVVSTALAESSLTVPGVRLVIDAGLSREPRRDARGMSGLVTVSASRAACEQRAGRAARQGPGVVVRCFDEKTFAAAPAYITPEIQTADLTQTALTLACWGSPGGKDLPLPDAPPAAAFADAELVLRGLGALDVSGHATDEGRRLASVPADPRLARALFDGAGRVGLRAAAEVVALLAGDLRAFGITAAGGDLSRALASLRGARGPERGRWDDEVRRLRSLAADVQDSSARTGEGRAAGEAETGYVAALANPEWIARRVSENEYLLASGTRAQLPGGSALGGHEWLAAAEVARQGSRALLRAGAPIGEDVALEAGAHLLTDRVEAQFDGGRVRARRERRLGAILLESTPVKATPEQARPAVVRALRVEGLGFSEKAEALRRRMGLLHRVLGDPWPDVGEAVLLERIEEWFAPEIEKLAAGADAHRMDLAEPLRRLLPWPAAVRFDELAPERMRVPSGNTARVEYPPVDDATAGESAGGSSAGAPGAEADGGDRVDGGQRPAGNRPVVAVKLQECFGWAETPALVDGRVPVLFHLLSPAGRPLAVTGDLASFWSGPYAQVRAEMRGRYPKHPWPEDPWTAPATAKTKNRM